MHASYQKQQKHAASLKVGDRVAYSAMWLKSTQAGRDYAKLRGTIICLGGVYPAGMINSQGDDIGGEPISEHAAVVHWDGTPTPKNVARFNLAKLKSAAFSEAPHMGKTHVR
jgi:hypothetical protein